MPWGIILKYGTPILAVFLLGWAVYSLGSSHGKQVIQTKWDHQKDVDAKAVAAEKTKIANQEALHNSKDKEISNELADLQATHDNAIAALRSQYADRLLDSTKRESIYRAKAEGTATERASLASYAAQLDRSLSQGISLVDEFQSTLEVRDGQIRALGAQILNDRQLINGSGSENGNGTGTNSVSAK